MSDNLTDTDEFTLLYISFGYGNLEATKPLVERRAALNNSKKYGVTPLVVDAQSAKCHSLLHRDTDADFPSQNCKQHNYT
jgi:hypothetical protein